MRALAGEPNGLTIPCPEPLRVPHRREKRLGNSVKNLSWSADIPKLSIIFITRKEMLTNLIVNFIRGVGVLYNDIIGMCFLSPSLTDLDISRNKEDVWTFSSLNARWTGGGS